MLGILLLSGLMLIISSVAWYEFSKAEQDHEKYMLEIIKRLDEQIKFSRANNERSKSFFDKIKGGSDESL